MSVHTGPAAVYCIAVYVANRNLRVQSRISPTNLRRREQVMLNPQFYLTKVYMIHVDHRRGQRVKPFDDFGRRSRAESASIPLERSYLVQMDFQE